MDEQVIKRIMPHNSDAERSVIGSMIIDKDAVMTATEILKGEDFYTRQFGILFDAMSEMFGEGVAIDVVTLFNRLKQKDVPQEVCSLEYIDQIVSSVPTSANIKYYAEIVAEKSLLRKTIKTLEDITNTCYKDKDTAENIMQDTEKKVFELVQKNGGSGQTDIKDIVLECLDAIEAAAKNGGSVTGIPTGFYDFDYKTAGLHPSDLLLIAARPAMGKTTFALNIADYVGVRQNITTAVFSLEMSNKQIVDRILSMHAKVELQKINRGQLNDEEMFLVLNAAREIGSSGLIIDDTPAISISELRSKCRKYKIERNLGLIVIDYLQLMTAGKKSESRQQEVSEISRSLKALAKELNCPVIALSQLSRAVEQRPDKRPMLSDLRESGAIEQDADLVMFIYRDDYYNKDTEEPGISEVIIGKHRNGSTGTVKLKFMGEYTKFANLEH